MTTEFIGSGTYGKVICNPDNETVVKVVDKFENSEQTQYCQQNIHEAVFLSQYAHCNIVESLGITMAEDKIHIKLKKYQTSLHDYIHATKYADRMKKLDIIVYKILLALNYIHSNNLIHGDLKPGNIMFNNEPTDEVRVIDFGGLSSFRLNKHSCICTYEFRAPEEWDQDNNTLDDKFDVWSLGVTIFYFIAKDYVVSFKKDTDSATKQQYKNFFTTSELVLRPDVMSRLEKPFEKLVRSMLMVKKQDRITVKELLASQYFKKFRSKKSNNNNDLAVKINTITPNYCSKLSYLTQLRHEVINKIYDICDHQKCLECFLHSIVLYDNYLTSGCKDTKSVSFRKSRLIAVCCLLISSILLLEYPFKFAQLLELEQVKKYKSINKKSVIKQTDKIMLQFKFKLYFDTFDWQIFKNKDLGYSKIKKMVYDPNYIRLCNSDLNKFYLSK